MKKILLVLILFSTLSHYGQTLSETHIIYGYKNIIIMDNGQKFTIVNETPFYEVHDNSIPQLYELQDHVLRLNRVIVMRDDEGTYKKLIEWVKHQMTFYELRKIDSSLYKENKITNLDSMME
ncbi:hypothetical protein ACFSTE_17625 [Aquimarina hainanensis]|uniref:DUF4294 domain-containing protein n=1 Tax=Aquimarina hainanensis TaxID=1578017 RepID=A0ABW5NB44_9FLAO